MKRLNLIMSLACASMMAACASHNAGVSGSAAQPVFDLSITDNVDLHRFELVLRSLDSRPLCMDVEQWPNGLGQVDWHGRQGVLQSKGGSFSAKDANFGFCPGGCGVIRIAPGAEQHSFVPFSEFGNPKMIANLQDRRLDFTVTPRVCAGNEKTVRTQE